MHIIPCELAINSGSVSCGKNTKIFSITTSGDSLQNPDYWELYITVACSVFLWQVFAELQAMVISIRPK